MGERETFTYAIADLHGRLDLLTKAYDAISEHSAGKPITIVHLGDYVDRGPQSREVIEWLMDDPALPPWVRRVCLQGNHEAMMLETIRAPLHPEWWIGNGGGQTLISYGHEPRGVYNPSVVPADHLDWIASRPLHHADQHRLFVHAGVQPSVPLNEQTEHALQWMIWPAGSDGDYRGLHIVHGHEQFADGPKCFAGRTDLDTFAWHTGRLVVGVFDDSKRASTKGPWRAVRAPHGPIDIFDSQGRDVVTVYGGGVGSESRVANAHLIAAAPDMFEALAGLLEHYLSLANSGDAGFWDPEKEAQVIAARSVIAKAEGLTNLADAHNNPTPEIAP